jgi:hypothetical protein
LRLFGGSSEGSAHRGGGLGGPNEQYVRLWVPWHDRLHTRLQAPVLMKIVLFVNFHFLCNAPLTSWRPTSRFKN